MAIHDAGIATQASISPVLPFTPESPETLDGLVDHIWIDTLSIGDGAMGKHSKKLGIPALYEEHQLPQWYLKDLHIRVGKYFKKSYPMK